MDLFFSAIVSLLISQSQISSSQTPFEYGYRPPQDRPEPQRVESQGKRGGQKNELVRLKLLAPTDHIARTISTHPTFWVETNQKKPIQYSLINQERQQLWQGELVPQSNLFPLRYRPDLPPLKPGVYVLAIAVGCPSDCTGFRVAFEKVEASIALNKELEDAENLEEKIEILAKAGLWYDAQSKIMESSETE